MSYIHFHIPLTTNCDLEYKGLPKVIREIYIESATVKVGTNQYIKTRHTLIMPDPDPENFIEYDNVNKSIERSWVSSKIDDIFAIETENIRLLELQNDSIQSE